jgi:hypothetical protein
MSEESHTPLFDGHRVDVGTLVVYASGTRLMAVDPLPYLKLKRGWKIPPRPWPLFDRDGAELTA